MLKCNLEMQPKDSRPYVCCECHAQFALPGSLMGHILRVHYQDGYTCVKCSKSFDDYNKMMNHRKYHKSRCTCHICDKRHFFQFELRQHLEMHLRTEMPKSSLEYPILDPEKDQDNLIKKRDIHLGISSPIATYQCPTCGAKLRSKGALQKHIKNVHGTCKCTFCFKKYLTMDQLGDHMRRKHKDGDDLQPYQCTMCRRSYSTKKGFRTHMMEHKHIKCRDIEGSIGHNVNTEQKLNEEYAKGGVNKCVNTVGNALRHKVFSTVYHNPNPARPFMCDICGLCSASKVALREHKYTHTGEKPYKCTLCDKSYRQPNSLTVHMNSIHLQVSSHVCNICGRGFHRSTVLKYHMRFHTGEKPHKCNVCGNAYRTPAMLHGHSIKHRDTKAYPCMTCGKSFKTGTDRKNHMRIHLDERPIKCPICGKGFNQLYNMKTHMRVHSGERPYVCNVCGMTFPHQGSWKKHSDGHSLQTELT